MRRIKWILIYLALPIGLVCFLFLPVRQITYALGSVTAEFSFVIQEQITRKPIPGAMIRVRSDEFPPDQSRVIAELITDDRGIAKFVRKNQSVKSVVGIRAGEKLAGVRRHPQGVGTFVDRYWCTLDITAKGYSPIEFVSLSAFKYDDNGYDQSAQLHRFQFVIEMSKE